MEVLNMPLVTIHWDRFEASQLCVRINPSSLRYLSDERREQLTQRGATTTQLFMADLNAHIVQFLTKALKYKAGEIVSDAVEQSVIADGRRPFEVMVLVRYSDKWLRYGLNRLEKELRAILVEHNELLYQQGESKLLLNLWHFFGDSRTLWIE